MTLNLGQSSVLPIHPYQSNQSITKKISNYIFRFQDKIGQGNFSKVYKGYHQLTNQLVAIKIVQLSSVKSAKLQELLFSQIEVIQSLNHINILKCHEVLKSQNNCYIITQLCDGGDLQTLLKNKNAQTNYQQLLIQVTFLKDYYIWDKEELYIEIQKQLIYFCIRENVKLQILVLRNIQIIKIFMIQTLDLHYICHHKE